MPAQSKQQQKFMGLVHAIQKGDVPASDASPEAQKAAQDMKPSDVKDFASTSHKGLPRKVKQEILKKLKEYAMTLPNHHAKPAAPMVPLRSDDEMDLQKETRIPQNFNVGTTRDYHTKLATTPRKKYDKTNFNPAHSGQEDLEEAQAVSGGKVHKFITGKNLGFKGKKYSEIDFETLGVDNKNGTIRLKILAPKEIFGNEISLDFRSVRRGPYFKTDTSKVNEASPCWDGYKQVGMKTKGGRQVPNCVKESVNEAAMNPVKKVVNAILKKHKVDAMKTTSTSVRGFHNIKNGGYKYDGDYFLQFYKVPQDTIEKIAAEMKKAGVKGVQVNMGNISADYTKTGLSNSQFESVNELKLSDLVGNQYKYAIGNSDEKYLGPNDKKYVLGMVGKALEAYLYDGNFALNYLDGAQRKEYNRFFENEILKPMLSKIDFTLNNFFTLDKDKVKWTLSSNDTRKMIDEIFRKNKKIPADIKREYYDYRLDYAGVKLKESSKADIIKDLDKAKNDLLKKVDVLIAKKKKLYSNVDIESPMTADEKKLDKDIADLFSQLNQLVLQKRSLKEYGQALDLHFILNKDAKLDGTPEPKKAIGEELSLDEKEMVIGIIEILKQVEDPKNRMRIALNMLKKFKEEDIEFDYRKFIDHLKEYSMGSYEYDKGNRELGESIIKSMKKVVIDLLPTNTLARHAGDPNKNKEFVEKIVKELGTLLNRFYKQNDIDVVLK